MPKILHQHVSTPFSFSVNFTCAEAEKTHKTKSNTYLFILKIQQKPSQERRVLLMLKLLKSLLADTELNDKSLFFSFFSFFYVLY